MTPGRAKGRSLTAIARDLFGVRRRWWGLEPDWLLRRRLLRGFLVPRYQGRAAGLPRRRYVVAILARWWQQLTRK